MMRRFSSVWPDFDGLGARRLAAEAAQIFEFAPMSGPGKHKCLSCKEFYRPDHRSVHHQRYCSKRACCKESKAQSQRAASIGDQFMMRDTCWQLDGKLKITSRYD